MLVHKKFYFNNPVTLVLFKAIYSENQKIQLEAAFVDPDPTKKDYEDWHKKDADFRFTLSEKICEYFEITLSRIPWSEFLLVSNPFTESLLSIKTPNKSKDLIMYAGDMYCIFGFSSFTRFLRTKIKLIRHFRNNLKIEKTTNIYALNPQNKKSKYVNIINIDIDRSKYLFEIIHQKLGHYLLVQAGLKLTNDFIIVLPQPNFSGKEYESKFFNIVQDISRKEKLPILVKPHKKDKAIYSDYNLDNFLKPSNPEIFQLIPVEFLFFFNTLSKVIAAPSTSLIFVENKKLELLISKDRVLYRRYFLDQIPYINFIGKRVTRI